MAVQASSGMAYRIFTDRSGVEWTVYDVVPRPDERRSRDRRDRSPESDDAHPERRSDDRRATVTTARPIRLTRGWLCFESSRERRRLQPIPAEWHSRSDAELASLLDEARIAPPRAS